MRIDTVGADIVVSVSRPPQAQACTSSKLPWAGNALAASLPGVRARATVRRKSASSSTIELLADVLPEAAGAIADDNRSKAPSSGDSVLAGGAAAGAEVAGAGAAVEVAAVAIPPASGAVAEVASVGVCGVALIVGVGVADVSPVAVDVFVVLVAFFVVVEPVALIGVALASMVCASASRRCAKFP